MDWNAAIENNLEALKRLLAALVAMVAMADGSTAKTLSRRIHRAALRLLRPAEAAVRRLVVIAARGIVVSLPPVKIIPGARPRPPKRIVERLAFALLDPLRTPRRRPPPSRPTVVPRIWVFGAQRPPVPVRPLPQPDDIVDATRLGLRLDALGRVLNDLPRQARRFARWRARRDKLDHTQFNPRRLRRLSPLKPGLPPGIKRRSWQRPRLEIHQVLRDLHGLAFWAQEKPNTS